MKPRVLMIAYACDPQGGGEHWLGWGWAQQAAQNFELDLITTPKARAAIEESSQAVGIRPHFVQTPAAVRTVTEAAGGGWWRKLAWQKKATRLAAALHRERNFHLVHQTTFHTFRVPFLAAGLGIPSVWGPIAGGERVPPGFESYLGSAKYSEGLRMFVNKLWLNFPAVKRSLRASAAIFVSNRVTRQFLPATYREKCTVVPPNALRPEDEMYRPRPAARGNPSDPFRLLYVGNCVATRAVPMALEALQASGLTNFEFSIVGAGSALATWKRKAAELHLQTKVKFAGKVPYGELAGHYARADLLVFPAMRDSGGSALLEAMARFVPVICLDWAGPGEMVDASSGFKLPVLAPKETVRAFAETLAALARDPERRSAVAQAGRVRAEALFRWQAKRELLESTYNRLLRA